MDTEKLKDALFEKMSAEQDKYRAWLVAQPPNEILNHTSEYTTREDILMAMEFVELTEAQVNALLESPTPLADVYKNWSNMEFNFMDNIVSAIEDRADTVIRQAEELYKSPVYKYPGSYARENGELEQYRASNKANIACREAIEKAVNEHYSHNCLDSKAAVKDVVEKFGYDRTLYVLAVTVRRMDWDGRISSKNKEWARTVPVIEDPDGWGNDRNACFVVSQCHPGLTNMFITEARHEYTEITISAEKSEHEVIIQFQNSGEDIPSEALAALFDKFYRADKSRSSDTGGTGLGLAIAKEIVILHGGAISASSKNHVVTFTISLPLAH